MTHPHTTDTAPRRHTTGRAGKAQGAPQDRGHSTTQKHSTQKKAQESTQEYIEVCYSSSVEHKGTDTQPLHLLPSERTWHKASEPALCPLLRAGGARHRRRYYPDPKCNAGRGRRGFFADKIKKILTISLRKAGRRLGNGPETEN